MRFRVGLGDGFDLCNLSGTVPTKESANTPTSFGLRGLSTRPEGLIGSIRRFWNLLIMRYRMNAINLRFQV